MRPAWQVAGVITDIERKFSRDMGVQTKTFMEDMGVQTETVMESNIEYDSEPEHGLVD